jgi:DNA-binding MarR family transcriptional regulator
MAKHERDLEFDDLVHQPTRLQLFAYLYRHDGTSFGQLSDDLDLTEGNLSSHLQRMEEAGAVDIEKEFVEKKPSNDGCTHQRRTRTAGDAHRRTASTYQWVGRVNSRVAAAIARRLKRS